MIAGAHHHHQHQHQHHASSGGVSSHHAEHHVHGGVAAGLGDNSGPIGLNSSVSAASIYPYPYPPHESQSYMMSLQQASNSVGAGYSSDGFGYPPLPVSYNDALTYGGVPAAPNYAQTDPGALFRPQMLASPPPQQQQQPPSALGGSEPTALYLNNDKANEYSTQVALDTESTDESTAAVAVSTSIEPESSSRDEHLIPESAAESTSGTLHVGTDTDAQTSTAANTHAQAAITLGQLEARRNAEVLTAETAAAAAADDSCCKTTPESADDEADGKTPDHVCAADQSADRSPAHHNDDDAPPQTESAAPTRAAAEIVNSEANVDV